MHKNMCSTIAIIILYNSTKETIEKWKNYIEFHPEVFFLFVDNSECGMANIIEFSNATTISNEKNVGIAAAQNIGIKYAESKKFKYVIFFDQDSEIAPFFLQNIVLEFEKIKKNDPQIVILGPTIINKDLSVEYKHCDSLNKEGNAIVSSVISSGSIVDVDSFSIVGLMNEKMFIDYVDFEWCWRAQSKGYLCYRTHNIVLPHKVGQNLVSFCGYPIIISAPSRYFYQYRNFIWLLKLDYVPGEWKAKMLVRKLVELLILPLLVKQKFLTMKYMMEGLFAGILNK